MRHLAILAVAALPASALAASGSNLDLNIGWIDQDEPGAPPFQWTDISGTGTALVNPTDDSVTQITPVFNFPLGGTVFSDFYIHSNGQIFFQNSPADYTNDPLTGGSNPGLSPFWDDLDPGNGTGFILWEVIGNELIIQWEGVPRFPNDGSYTMQAVLRTDGTFEYRYLSMDNGSGSDTGDSASIGVVANGFAEEISYNTAGAVQNNGYYMFSPGGGGGFTNIVSTSCPNGGPGSISWGGATPSGQIAILGASSGGSFPVPGGPCQGTLTNLGPASLVGILRSDVNGTGSLVGTHLQTDCGTNIQLLDVSTCSLSNVQIAQ